MALDFGTFSIFSLLEFQHGIEMDCLFPPASTATNQEPQQSVSTASLTRIEYLMSALLMMVNAITH